MSPPDILVRPLTASDIPAVRRLHASLLPVHYPSSFFLHLLIQSDRTCLIALADHQPIAFVSASIHHRPPPGFQTDSSNESGPHIQILTLGVLAAFQGAGLARSLIHAAIQNLSRAFHLNLTRSLALAHADMKDPVQPQISVYVQTSISNSEARGLYEHLGMQAEPNVFKDLYRNSPMTRWSGILLTGTFGIET